MKWETVTDAPCNNAPTSASDVECQQQAQQDSPGAGPYDAPMLIIKPAFAIIQVGDVLQYATFLVQGGIEQEINSGLQYTSNQPGLAQIGVATGSAVGLAEGIVTITVEWGGMFASAQLQVVESCSDSTTALMLLVDCSPSMGQAMPGYASKIAFAKMAALRIANELNVAKDSMLLGQFEAAMNMVVTETTDKTLMAAAINNLEIVNTNGGTNLLSAVKSAADTVNATAASVKVVVVFTDGVCNEIGDPTVPALLAQIAATGVVVIVLGVRAAGDGFNLLQMLATGGFIGNAYDLWTGQDALDMVSGMKGYLCAGGCEATEPYTVNEGAANFTAFTDWTVDSGQVDLFGNNFMDFLPGNGLYVNLAGIGATEEGPLTFQGTFAANVFPVSVGSIFPDINFAIPKIVDGIRVRTKLYDEDLGIGLLKQFSVYGRNGGVTTLIKTFILDCADPDEINHLIGPASDVILRLENNTAYQFYYITLDVICGAETHVYFQTVDWYTKAVANVPSNGKLVTISTFTSVPTEGYELIVRMAGNQRNETYTDQVRIRVGVAGGPYVLDETVTVPWNTPFTDYTFAFTAGALAENWEVSIEQISTAVPGSGILLDNVDLELPIGIIPTIFNYGFDAENPQVVQPPCPSAYAYLYTNCGGYGCLDNPPGAQHPDPNPPPFLE